MASLDRIIYCPNDSMIQEAEELSVKYRRNILIGENSNTKKLEFNRDKVQLLNVPRVDRISVMHEKIVFGLHQSITYENEFFVLKNNTKLFVNKIPIKSLYEEKHKVKFLFNEYKIGTNVFEITVNGRVEKNGDFYVD